MKIINWFKSLFSRPVELAWSEGENGMINVYAIQRRGKNIELARKHIGQIEVTATTEAGDWSVK